MQELKDARDNAKTELAEWDAENADALKALESFNEEGEQNSSEWTHGETVIREDYFEEYAKQLVEDIGDLPKDIPSYIEIDWTATAKNLEADYSTIEWDGENYLVRSS